MRRSDHRRFERRRAATRGHDAEARATFRRQSPFLTADRPHRPKEILILVAADRASEIAARLARQYNVSAYPRVLVPLLDGAIVRLRFTGIRSVELLLEALSTDPDVQDAQPNYDYRAGKGEGTSPRRAAICRRKAPPR